MSDHRRKRLPTWATVREAAVFLVFTVFFLTYGLTPLLGGDGLGLVGADEPRYAQIAHEMLDRFGSAVTLKSRLSACVTPYLYGHPWLEKPALYYWRAMFLFQDFGVHDWSARLPSTTFAFIMIGLIYLHMRRFRPGGHLDAALITVACVGIIGFSRGASTDMQMAAPLAIGLLGWYAWYETGSKFWLYDIYFFTGLATLAKGPVAPFLAALIIAAFAFLRREWTIIRRSFWWPGMVLYFAMVLPWFIAVQHQNPTFFREFFLEHNLERFATDRYEHSQPFWYYLVVVVLAMMPWTVVAVRALVDGVQTSVAEWRVRHSTSAAPCVGRPGDAFPEFLVLWALFPVVFFTFSKSKLPGYILPSIPPITILIGDYLNRIRRVGLPRWLLWSHAAACAVMIFVLVLSPQHMVYETLVPSTGWLICAGAAALLVFFAVVQTIRIGGISQVRSATLFPVLAAMVFLLGFHGKDLDLNYSARPLARQMRQQAPDVHPLAFEDVRRDIVYGLAFYRDEEPIDYCEPSDKPRLTEENCSGGVDIPAGQHLLVIPANETAKLEQWLPDRVYEPLFLYESQGLAVYRIYAKP